jgi:hypothetical protein
MRKGAPESLRMLTLCGGCQELHEFLDIIFVL